MAEALLTRNKTCKQCAKTYPWTRGVGQKFRGCCSVECHTAADNLRRKKPTPDCLGCGVCLPSAHHKRCAPCNEKHYEGYHQRRARALGVKPMAEAIAARRASSVRYSGYLCTGCGEAFVPKAVNRMAYCSGSCHRATIAKSAQIRREALYALRVETTALRLIRTGMPACLKRINQIRVWIDRSKAPCLACASPIGAKRAKVSTTAYCSSRCVQTQPHYTEFKRTARLKGKARKRAATVESVSPARVFERDGWMCHLCGGKTLKDKRGTYHPKAPELDHIVPLSKGGEHSYRNTACAHRKCNAAKSDKIMGQPSLLAA